MKQSGTSVGLIFFILAAAVTPNTLAWKLPVFIFGAGVLAASIRSFLSEGKALDHKRKRELQRQHIRELEEDLGYEPLNLGELDPLFEENRNHNKE